MSLFWYEAHSLIESYEVLNVTSRQITSSYDAHCFLLIRWIVWRKHRCCFFRIKRTFDTSFILNHYSLAIDFFLFCFLVKKKRWKRKSRFHYVIHVTIRTRYNNCSNENISNQPGTSSFEGMVDETLFFFVFIIILAQLKCPEGFIVYYRGGGTFRNWVRLSESSYRVQKNISHISIR